MKTGSTCLKILALALAAGLGSGTFDAAADSEVFAAARINTVADFDKPLAANGTWVDTSEYGRCWRPAGVAVNWQPYCDGTWVWTDCGWYWQSDVPWAWACYHYGSWIYDPDYGWVWVPGVAWAPAWVYWRIGGGYIGWAPCSPRGVVDPKIFVFVDECHFHERHRRTTLVVNNQTIYNHTRQIPGDRHESREIGDRRQTVMVNAGPDVSIVEKATGRQFNSISVPAPDTSSGEMPEHPGKPAPPEKKPPPTKAMVIPTPPPPAPGPPAIPPSSPAWKHKPVPPQQPSEPEMPPAGMKERSNRGKDKVDRPG
jgi:Family of unknown function (DUF6600)